MVYKVTKLKDAIRPDRLFATHLFAISVGTAIFYRAMCHSIYAPAFTSSSFVCKSNQISLVRMEEPKQSNHGGRHTFDWFVRVPDARFSWLVKIGC
jgi:hypothetical protein